MPSIVCISDLHLGASNSQTKKINKVLEVAEDYDIMVINGDIIDSNLKRLKPKEWKVLETISKINKKGKTKVVIVSGNHDEKSQDFLGEMLGIQYRDFYIGVSANKTFYFEHGHKYDDFIVNNPGLTAIADSIYMTLQALDPSHSIARFVKHASKEFIRCTNKVEEGIITKKNEYNCTFGVGSHVHNFELNTETGYINTGCFTEKPCSFLSIQKGKPKIEFI